jgi:hypothetical protein
MMKRTAVLAGLLALSATNSALALPAVGDALGTDADTVRSALEAQGCAVTGFEAEDGKVEAKCREAATGKAWEVYIDPATGKVTKVAMDD